MANYVVRIFPNSLSYEIPADNEHDAIQKAKEYAYGESAYDIFKWADYEAEEK